MSRPQLTVRSSARVAGWALGLAAGITLVGTSTVWALTLPSPGTSPAPTAPGTVGVPVVSGLVGQVTAPLTGGATGSPSASSGPSGSATALPALPAVPSSSSLSAVGSGLKSGLATAQANAAGTPLSAVVPGPAPARVLNLAVNASPLATACLQVTGSGTAVANTTVTVAGQNVTAPLVQALPGLLAPCPRGQAPSPQGLDASVAGLVGACVRVTPQPPLHASLLVLDKELVAGLTRAGVPLQQVVVPCPAGTAHAVVASQGGSAAGTVGHAGGSRATTGSPSGSHGSAGHAGAACAPGGSDGGSSIDARTTAASIVPHDAPQALPWILLGLALVGRRRLGRVTTALQGGRPVIQRLPGSRIRTR